MLMQAHLLLSNIAGVEEHILSGAGHACYLDAPAEFNELVLEFSFRVWSHTS